MKTKFLTIGLLLIFAFAACERKTNHPVIREADDTEVLSEVELNNPQDTTKQDSTNILQEICGDSQILELWYTEDFSYGSVSIFNDSEYLYIQYDVKKELADQGWSIHTSYLFTGDYSELNYLENGSIDWHSMPVEDKAYNDNPTSAVRMIPIAEIEDACFGVATKVKLNNPDPTGQNPNPRAFINIDGKLSYPWKADYSYCIQTCSD